MNQSLSWHLYDAQEQIAGAMNDGSQSRSLR
jgi:hypothetical protein